MHPQMLSKIVETCRQRQNEGDHPTVTAFTVEQLEDAVVALSDNIGRLLPPDEECEAGVAHPEAALRTPAATTAGVEEKDGH